MYATKIQLACIIVGIIFGVAWWIFIDGVWYNQHISHYAFFFGYETMPGIGATIAFVMINLIELKYVIGKNTEETTSRGCSILIQIWFYWWLTILVICNGGSLWIFIKNYRHSWTGAALFIQTFLIMIDALLLLVVRHLFRK